MKILIETAGRTFAIDGEKPLNIAIALDFNGAQPNAYGVEKAASTACEAGEIVGDTRRGGSCNFEQIKMIPHCSGTHTECVGHITNERISVNDCLKDAFALARLISVKPEFAKDTSDTYAAEFDADDLLITKKSLENALGKDKSALEKDSGVFGNDVFNIKHCFPKEVNDTFRVVNDPKNIESDVFSIERDPERVEIDSFNVENDSFGIENYLFKVGKGLFNVGGDLFDPCEDLFKVSRSLFKRRQDSFKHCEDKFKVENALFKPGEDSFKREKTFDALESSDTPENDVFNDKQDSGAEDIAEPGFLNCDALVVRTLPNDENKLSKTYLEEIPPFFSTEAMQFIRELGIKHLLCDLPSIDRIFDEGKLSNHRIFWNVEQGSFEVSEKTLINNTITELIYVPEIVKDGAYLLNLQIAPFVADAAPSRPVLFEIISS